MRQSEQGPGRRRPRLVSLIPNSGLQFFDAVFPLDALAPADSSFWEEQVGTVPDESGRIPVLLRTLAVDEDTRELVDRVTRQRAPEDEVYRLNRSKGLEVFLDKWVPLPFLRIKARGSHGEEVYDNGPSNWARVRVTELAQRDADGNSHGVTVLFDSGLRPREEGRPYVALAPSDSVEEQEFTLVDTPEEIAWFLGEAWIDEWLETIFKEFLIAQKGRALRDSDFQHACEHWARYLAFLRLLADTGVVPHVRLVDTLSRQRKAQPIDVDLVLDIGNSRTCGILVEYSSEQAVNLKDSYQLKLRDLSRPEHTYEDPFESRIELTRVSFGMDAISRRSGRGNAFSWPSPVRIGPEAMRLASRALGNEGLSGISSPKRYLWDERPVVRGWRYNLVGQAGVSAEPPVTGAFLAYVTEGGDVIRQSSKANQQPAMRAMFSRSAMFTFLLVEILMQALAQINAVENRSKRSNADIPRRLRRVILTMPPAMPLAEQRIMRKRAEGAVKLAWDLLGWEIGNPDAPPEPRIIMNLDEASCTQFVFLYSEVADKFQGDAEALFSIWGRAGEQGAPPRLRIASIDIGGGTTDLMISSFTVEGRRAINPDQEFREGFRIAGDDILAAVIERCVIPVIADGLGKAGVADPLPLLRRLIGGDFGGQSETERHVRRQFVNQILEPAGIALLQAYEGSPPHGGVIWQRRLGDLLSAERQPDERVLGFVDEPAARLTPPGAEPFRLLDVLVHADWAAIDGVIRAVLGPVLADLCEVIHHYDCDFLLLSGRPSRLHAVRDMAIAKLPVMPDRIIPMHLYAVGSWYPFRRHSNERISDPKTTAAVGAMLYSLAEGHLESFLMRASKVRMKSTARYIGEMELSGQIRKNNVLLSDVDLDQKARDGERRFEMKFYAPIFLGFRQLPVERWPASPLYYLEFSNPDSAARMALPLTLTIERGAIEDEREEDREALKLTDIRDAQRDTLKPSDVRLRLQTLKSEAGYWLDTGVLSVQ